MTSKAARKDKKPRDGRGCTEEMVDLIVDALESGKPLAVLCREDGMPGLRTVYDWMAADEAVAKRIQQAREVGEDVIAAGCLEIVDETPPPTAAGGTDSGFVQHQKLRVWTRLQLLAKWNPKRWGEKVEQTIQGGDKPLQIDGVRFTVVDPKG